MPNKGIILIGGGGHCLSVLDSILSKRSDSVDDNDDSILITDRELAAGTKVLRARVVGGDERLSILYDEGYRDAFITVGSLKKTDKRRELADKAGRIGFGFPVIVDPSAIVSGYSSLSDGVYVGKNAVINAKATVGAHVIVNTGAVVEHSCKIGSFSHISINATVCGDVMIGEDVMVGAGATVIQGVKIGNQCLIGAGSIVLRDVPEGTRVIGIWRGIK